MCSRVILRVDALHKLPQRAIRACRASKSVWSRKRSVGATELAALEARLTELVGDTAIWVDAPGWVAGDRN